MINTLYEQLKDCNIPVVKEDFIFTNTLAILGGKVTVSQKKTNTLAELLIWGDDNKPIGNIILIGPNHISGIVAICKAMIPKEDKYENV